jgi:hypothetical protein
MHIAVLIYGRLNNCIEHYNNIRESLGKHNDIHFFLSSDQSPESLLNGFISLYQPKLYNNQAIHYECNLSIYPGKREETNIHNMICHFMNKNRVFLLLEEYIQKENIQYDCVVSLRVDCIFQTNFIFNDIRNNTIYIPNGFDYVDRGINDQIAYGKLDVMRKYNSIHAADLLDKKLSIPHPESLTYANIHFHRLQVSRVHLEYVLDK